MKRLHLVTSRKPLPGAVAEGDRLIFMQPDSAVRLLGEVLRDNPHISDTALRIMQGTDSIPHLPGVARINYEELVRMVVAYDGVISW